jgi:hypothetical protein
MDNELEPEFRGLMLDNEEHFVVVGGVRVNFLAFEELVEPKELGVGHLMFEIGMDRVFDVAWARHGVILSGGSGRYMISRSVYALHLICTFVIMMPYTHRCPITSDLAADLETGNRL